MPRQVFTAGEILTAANMNDLSDQTVMVFDDSAARGSAIPSPSEGMVTYLKDTNEVEKYDGSAFVAVSQPGILQVVSTTKTDVFSQGSIASGSSSTPTGMSATITPTSTSSKILVLTNLTVSILYVSNNNFPRTFSFKVQRGGTDIGVGDAAGIRQRTTSSNIAAATVSGLTVSGSFLDSPNSTSALTYQVVLVNTDDQTGTFYLNRGTTDSDTIGRGRGASTITLIEVAG
jgi:hypothetical protein